MSRPATQMSGRLPQLPKIKHPLAERIPGDQLGGINTGVISRRPFPGESRPSSRPPSNLFKRRYGNNNADTKEAHNNVTERKYSWRGAGQDCVDPETLSPDVGDRGYVDIQTPDRPVIKMNIPPGHMPPSRCSTRVDMRLEVDEIEAIIREKCRHNSTEVQKRFRDNDPQGIGNITRDALLRVLVVLTTKPVPHLLFQKVLTRFGLENQTSFHFEDFIHRGNSNGNGTFPKWMSMNQSFTDKSQLTATQVHTVLKEKAKQRVFDLFDLIPQTTPDGARRLLKPEFRTALTQQLQINMTDDEFEKLWQRYDEQNVGVIDSKFLSSKFGIDTDGRATPKITDTNNNLRRKERERQQSLDTEQWLKNRFRQGFHELKAAFNNHKQSNKGMISASDFCSILESHGLKMNAGYLDEFLARCGVVQTKEGVPYLAFLKMFQDRSEGGMTHKILANPRHRYNRGDDWDNMSTMSALEAQLLNLFQRDFLSLLGIFHQLDKHKQGFVTQDQFRAAIENAFDVPLTDDQYNSFLEHVPLDKTGAIRYTDFMASFDTRGDTASLMSGSIPRPASELQMDFPETNRRNLSEVADIIRQLLTQRFELVEQRYSQLEAYNSGRITQDTLFDLLRYFDIDPPLTRGEIRELWETVLTNKDGTLSWLEFIRQFGFTGQTHTYPDAGRNPPKWGDSDYSLRSRKFNSDTEILVDGTKQKIEFRWEELRRAFVSLDPHKTGCVSDREFQTIVNETCVHVSNTDLNKIMNSHAATDSRVNYISFLSEFGPRKEVWHKGNDMFSLLAHPKTPFGMHDIVEPPQNGLIGVSAKLRNKLSGSWKNLRRAFQKLDKEGSGYLPLPQFRSVLQLANIVLDEDEVYHMMSQLDEDLSGRLDYKKFLNELFRPESQCSSRVSTRQSGLLPLSRQSLRQSVMSEHRAASRGSSRMSAMY